MYIGLVGISWFSRTIV